MSATRPLSVRRLAGSLGAEITGVDLTTYRSDTIGELQQLLREHRVLFFPDQQLDDHGHRRFGQCWGELEVHPLIPHVPDVPEVIELSSERGVADTWHTDVTFDAHPPTMSILRTVVTPSFGGDTMWSNQVAAFAALSTPMREMLRGLTATHAARSFGQPERQAVHPVVRWHPDTGEDVLYVNRLFTERIRELSIAESAAVLELLFAHCEQQRFTVRYRWAEGTVAVWDNRCTQHYVVDDFSGTRVIRRVTVSGDSPDGAPPSSEPHDDALREGSTTELVQRHK